MGASSFIVLPVGGGAAVGWAITLVLTFLFIALPAIYLLVMIFATDDATYDRVVSDVADRAKAVRRAQRQAWSRDVETGFERPAAGGRPAIAAQATISSGGGRT
jgi:hypothetical protein